jgi:hypothetical protein
MHETSFVRAPLNSRIDSGPSRLSGDGYGYNNGYANGGGADASKRPRNVSGGTNANGKGKGREEANRLDRLPLDIQEALILEDLLFVLMVCQCLLFFRALCQAPCSLSIIRTSRP